MSLMEIRKYPNPILKEIAGSIDDIDGQLQLVIDNMVETMYAAPGIGLAAPQVGESRCLIVVDVSSYEEEHPLIVLVNPEIVQSEGKVVSEEGCLSVPGYISTIERAERICVRGLDREGNPQEVEAKGMLARALQHEIDHLRGVLFVDRLSPIKREFFKRRYLRNRRNSTGVAV
jgi:peptide deformylase